MSRHNDFVRSFGLVKSLPEHFPAIQLHSTSVGKVVESARGKHTAQLGHPLRLESVRDNDKVGSIVNFCLCVIRFITYGPTVSQRKCRKE